MNLKLFVTLIFLFFINCGLLAQQDPSHKTFKPIFNPQGLIEPDVFYELEDAPVLPIEDYSEWLIGVGVVLVGRVYFKRKKQFIRA